MSRDDEEEPQPAIVVWPDTRLPLASLTPETSANSAYLEGVATLLWPFSQSSSTFSILVCEEDFRLRKSKGQLRVNFNGQSAREVQSKVQIGDKVRLSLEGVELKALESATLSDVPWMAEFSNKLLMKVDATSTGESTIQIDTPEEQLSTETLDNNTTEANLGSPATPATPEQSTGLYKIASENKWSTPGAIKRSLDLFSSSPTITHGLFDEEEEDYQPRKKARFSSSFRLIDRSPSPEAKGRQGFTVYQDNPPDADSLEEAPKPTRKNMFPPPVPEIVTDSHDNEQSEEMPDSPSLRPVPSPSLPLVSPFLHRGLSSGDYMSLDLDSQETMRNAPELSPHFLDIEINSNISELLEPPTSEPDSQIAPVVATKPPSSVPSPVPITESDGDSEKDSLFDDASDSDGVAQRQRSRSPLPGPSPLHQVVQATKSPEISPTKPSKLSIRTGFTPSHARRDSIDTPLKTPQLYLPTPSPKVNLESTHFPFTAPEKLDFGLSPFTDIMPSERRKLFGGSRQSAPTDLSAYFGRPTRTDPEGTAPYSQETTETIPTPASAEEPTFSDSPLVEDDLEDFRSGITTVLSDFPALAFLSWGQTVDIIGVVSQVFPAKRAKSSPKDYYISMRIVDSSQTAGVIIRIFRPYQEALPKADVGDIIMLRSFKIQSQKHKLMALSTENSAWAVWKDKGKARPGVCAGPPVEYGDEEEGYVEALGGWYANVDATKRQNMETRNKDDLETGIQ